MHNFLSLNLTEIINYKIVLLVQVPRWSLVMITLAHMLRKLPLCSSVFYIISKATDLHTRACALIELDGSRSDLVKGSDKV